MAIAATDSAVHRGVLGAGDVQWTTAGDGVIHSEMPSRRLQRDGGGVHASQVWVNLPASAKRTAPRYQEVPRARIPRAAAPTGGPACASSPARRSALGP